MTRHGAPARAARTVERGSSDRAVRGHPAGTRGGDGRGGRRRISPSPRRWRLSGDQRGHRDQLRGVGVLLAWFRPRNPVGWLLAGAGVAQNLTAATAPLLLAAERDGWSAGAVRTLATVYAYGWPWSIGLFLPMALLLFPTGRLPGRGWRWPAGLLIPAGVVFVLAMGAAPEGVDGTGQLLPWLVWPDTTSWRGSGTSRT